MKWATAFIGSTAVARFAGSDIFCFVTWGYARKASLHPRLYADARFAGSSPFFNNPILGLRSQSLAPPQALC